MPLSADTRRVWAGRLSVAVAASFVLIGVLRYATDTLHEFNRDYWHALVGTPFRYLVRAPSDGTLVGDLNAQCFKMLAMPAGLSLVWLRVRFGSGTLADRAARFRDLAVRGTWAASFLVGFTLIELEKTYHFLGMNAVLVAGERAWLNHVIHLVSAVLAWFLTDQLAFEPLTHAEITLERELDALEPSS
jgi:hypothetical protein